ncbi:YdeI/OmpD-associated family protein [Fictibacillus nanhaiensis]|uniref:YdeI/OmpD-associated family protein n=1 Tax=Fictibacillus nanhaiensis TaxID=742169 RepID=UPI00203DEAEB|nr:YdeI/OmpD-associated family protein [Fictibacillus nanhaiensis]MCM3733427.1 YdeI/OmpD-associated family protein [Fictibacillus nanhaiensis]
MNSTKSIVDKLNLKKYASKLILNLPEDIDEFKEIDFDAAIEKEKYDLIFIFVFNLEEFSNKLHQVIEKHLLSDKGYLFFAYPKKNNPQYKDFIERDQIFPYINVGEDGYVAESNLKFSRMVSLNDIFTVVGLKYEKKKAVSSSKKSQCVDDYIDHVDDIKRYLEKNAESLSAYNSLTFGYQKDWARYVYSAKREETQEKRLLEMEDILGEGYKSIDLYRRKKK